MTEDNTDGDVVGHILPRSGSEKQCEAWVELFEKLEGVEFEEIEWNAYGKTAYRIRSK